MEQVKKYGVVVGGWRLVSRHETIEQAKERASMCISRIVDIVDLEKDPRSASYWEVVNDL